MSDSEIKEIKPRETSETQPRLSKAKVGLFAGAVVLALGAVLAWSQGWLPGAAEIQNSDWVAEGVSFPADERGAALYQTHCALCHGARGEGYAADNAHALGNPDFLAIATDEFLTHSIAWGRPGTAMSAWSQDRHGPLSNDEIQAIVRHIRSLAPHTHIDLPEMSTRGDRTLGQAIFQRECVVCHGAAGEGVTAPGLANPLFQREASFAYLRHVIENGRRGTPMQGFGTKLSSVELDAVTMFVRSLPPLQREPNFVGTETMPTLETLVRNPMGRSPEFTLREERFVSSAQVKDALDQGRRIVLLDARATSDWMTSHIPGAGAFPFYDAERLAEVLPKDDTFIVAYCACPHAASGRVIDALRAKGFTHTAVLDEGIIHWTDQGYPLAHGEAPPPSDDGVVAAPINPLMGHPAAGEAPKPGPH